VCGCVFFPHVSPSSSVNEQRNSDTWDTSGKNGMATFCFLFFVVVSHILAMARRFICFLIYFLLHIYTGPSFLGRRHNKKKSIGSPTGEWWVEIVG